MFGDNPSLFYKLVENISFGFGEWVPIPEFKGRLDGNGRNVWFGEIEDGEEFTGLFRTNHGTIEKLNVYGMIRVTGGGVSAGIIAGLNEGIIRQCNVDTSGTSKGGGAYMIENIFSGSSAGGIAGVNNGEIYQCVNYGRIYSYGGRDAIAAENNGTIRGCSDHGELLP